MHRSDTTYVFNAITPSLKRARECQVREVQGTRSRRYLQPRTAVHFQQPRLSNPRGPMRHHTGTARPQTDPSRRTSLKQRKTQTPSPFPPSASKGNQPPSHFRRLGNTPVMIGPPVNRADSKGNDRAFARLHATNGGCTALFRRVFSASSKLSRCSRWSSLSSWSR